MGQGGFVGFDLFADRLDDGLGGSLVDGGGDSLGGGMLGTLALVLRFDDEGLLVGRQSNGNTGVTSQTRRAGGVLASQVELLRAEWSADSTALVQESRVTAEHVPLDGGGGVVEGSSSASNHC